MDSRLGGIDIIAMWSVDQVGSRKEEKLKSRGSIRLSLRRDVNANSATLPLFWSRHGGKKDSWQSRRLRFGAGQTSNK